MENIEKMKGGKREGAGRPVLGKDKKKRAISVFLPPDVIDLLNRLPGSRGVLIEMAVKEKYGTSWAAKEKQEKQLAT